MAIYNGPTFRFLIDTKSTKRKGVGYTGDLFAVVSEAEMSALHTFDIDGVVLSAYDGCASLSANRVAEELLNDIYGLDTIVFQPGDIVIDVGAHVGLVSMYLAKRWPFLRIYAFEPLPANHANCARNLLLNHVTNVYLSGQAVTSDRRSIMLQAADCNTGGATAIFDIGAAAMVGPVESVTLEDIFKWALAPTQRCRLLKIDCEGMEYEFLPSPLLDRVDFFAAEFHEGVLQDHGGVPSLNIGQAQALGQLCAQFFSPERMRIVCCQKYD